MGFVNTSVIAPEGKVTKICLRIMDPPTSVTFSADFRLKISLLQICKVMIKDLHLLHLHCKSGETLLSTFKAIILNEVRKIPSYMYLNLHTHDTHMNTYTYNTHHTYHKHAHRRKLTLHTHTHSAHKLIVEVKFCCESK